jgi:hypothetical protein
MKVTKEIQTGEFLLSNQRTNKEPIFVDNGWMKEDSGKASKGVQILILTHRKIFIFLSIHSASLILSLASFFVLIISV